jgi:hypothetical protein
LLGAGEVDDAIAHCATVLSQDPTSAQARHLMTRAMTNDKPRGESRPDEFDWSAAEDEVDGIAAPMFVTGDDEQPEPAVSAWEVEDAGVTLADVGGMRLTNFVAWQKSPTRMVCAGRCIADGGSGTGMQWKTPTAKMLRAASSSRWRNSR